ncbi:MULTISPECIES: ABC transporter permease [unclassified Variovorax]|uniref:ABC transporter permease n=1 Tax=unclassified Variovorax TaxID=663243 RepID=UPI00076DBC49|nr:MULTISPECIES: ABC transporter permease [unclassified Variovorax]KWT74696.1 High-affinity branched-chain amino acid transport system permease protein LivH [Variovorax sp. WDL1]PNG53080.1 High-affinity branched-chain amino acid transport system permease protein LivH [Variovorax sp. B2]PNG53652.1 High-affinity branched-chain amino acid transport system permease protein LivH [Variovorax sp. B4]VTV11088.1 LIV-I protein H [Variovorax sp. WDL1]
MLESLGILSPALFGQLLLGLINGSFYAMMSLGLAIIFGLLNVVNFTHGAQYMMGAFTAWMLLQWLGIGYGAALVLAPLVVGLSGIVLERLFVRRLYHLNHVYGLLLTFGLTLIVEGLYRKAFGSAGLPYANPMPGGFRTALGYLPYYRLWALFASFLVCLATWYMIEKTRLGSYLRAAIERPDLVRGFGINVPRMVTLVYGFGVGLAGLAGVFAAPIYNVSPMMGSNLIIVIFAVVVIGGMGSIKGAIITGYLLGLAEGLVRYYYPPLSDTVVFIIMAAVLLIKPAGLFGKGVIAQHAGGTLTSQAGIEPKLRGRLSWVLLVVSLAALVLAPFVVYPVFLIKVLCFAVAASAINLLLGYMGVLSFGHAMFFGLSAYVAGHLAKVWGLAPEWAILGATLASVALGALVGVIAIRLQGIYFAMSTLALAQMVYFVCLQAPFTHGEDGIQDIPRGVAFGVWDLKGDVSAYFFVLLICGAAILMIARLVHSPYGRIVAAVRDSEPRAISLGYNANRYKLAVFIFSAGVTGLAGATKAIAVQIASLTDVGWQMSGEFLLMTLVGGLGTITGPIIGALALIGMETYMAELQDWVTVAQGAVFFIVVLAFREGIVGSLSSFSRKRAEAKVSHIDRAAVRSPLVDERGG